MGGCAGSKPEDKNKKQEPAKTTNDKAEPKAAASPLPKKLSPEEIQKKRENMRMNLEEGHAHPPTIDVPHIQPVSNIH